MIGSNPKKDAPCFSFNCYSVAYLTSHGKFSAVSRMEMVNIFARLPAVNPKNRRPRHCLALLDLLAIAYDNVNSHQHSCFSSLTPSGELLPDTPEMAENDAVLSLLPSASGISIVP